MAGPEPTNEFLEKVIPLNLAIESLVDDCMKIVDEHKSSDSSLNIAMPYSILLTEHVALPKGSDAIQYARLNQGGFFDLKTQAKLLPQYNEIKSLKELCDSIPFAFSAVRLSVLPPSTIIKMHQDKAAHAQLAITTNDDSFVISRRGEMVHVPVDGNIYIFSTTIHHTALNASDVERIHMSISVL